MKLPVTIDFETFGIGPRPHEYPPKPVGVSIKYPGKKAKYYGWGHPSENNCTWREGQRALAKAWGYAHGLLFHNAKFDLDVATTHMDVEMPHWTKVHDTMLLLFLNDPEAWSLSLKPSAERYLNLPPDEQDEVRDYLIENQPVVGVKISKGAGKVKEPFGKYIAYAPGKLVGKYANGDVERTEALFKHVADQVIVKRKMSEAYDRERKLLIILLYMERKGVAVDVERLRLDIRRFETEKEKIERKIRNYIKADLDINLDSGDQLIETMLASGVVKEEDLLYTDKGKVQTNKAALDDMIKDQKLKQLLVWRTQLSTCLNTFMKPWYETAKEGGLIYTQWNQIRSTHAGGSIGTRTGRLSSTPNFQNIPKMLSAFKGMMPLPLVRDYLIPFKGHVFVDRDYSQQEPRILAHFEDGQLRDKYIENPWIDFHDTAQEELAHMGLHYERRPVKNTNLGLIYGMGVGLLAERSGLTVQEAKTLKAAILRLYPGLKDMYADMKTIAALKEPIRTWGGREYYCEEPKVVKNRLMSFDYKMVNKLIQGSAADCTKEAIIRFWDHPDRKQDWFLVLNVHDQLTVSCPTRDKKAAMEILRETMESIEFDVPMLTEGAWSKVSWHQLQDYDVKGKRV